MASPPRCLRGSAGGQAVAPWRDRHGPRVAWGLRLAAAAHAAACPAVPGRPSCCAGRAVAAIAARHSPTPATRAVVLGRSRYAWRRCRLWAGSPQPAATAGAGLPGWLAARQPARAVRLSAAARGRHTGRTPVPACGQSPPARPARPVGEPRAGWGPGAWAQAPVASLLCLGHRGCWPAVLWPPATVRQPPAATGGPGCPATPHGRAHGVAGCLGMATGGRPRPAPVAMPACGPGLGPSVP